MSYTKRNTIICDECHLFCRPFDEYTPFGCSSYDPPEPVDPLHICKKCFPKVKKRWIEYFKKGYKDGDYLKSTSEMEAAKECGLIWIGGSGHGTLGSKNFAESSQYITEKEYNRLSKFPYWGYCKICGAENKNGHCSNVNCKNSFKNLTK